MTSPAHSPENDIYWNDFFDVALVPNPMLSEKQQKVVAQDYIMADGRVSVPVRKALLYYFHKRLRLDARMLLTTSRNAGDRRQFQGI